MRATIGSRGRLVIPKPLREELGLTAGSTVDVTRYGQGLQLTPGGHTARLVEVDGRLVASSDRVVTDDDVLGLLDRGRR
jgi:AbrB family looped-hinge helix DNA binding protein